MVREFKRIEIATSTTPSRPNVNARKAIEDVFKDHLSGIELHGPQLLIATYIRPQVTSGGIHLTDNYRREDEYQGKVGLVLAIGPTAFKESGGVDFGGRVVKIGDWVVYSPHDGLPLNLTRQHCRLIDDVQVRMVINDPDIVM